MILAGLLAGFALLTFGLSCVPARLRHPLESALLVVASAVFAVAFVLALGLVAHG